jgi:hypothetical protein
MKIAILTQPDGVLSVVSRNTDSEGLTPACCRDRADGYRSRAEKLTAQLLFMPV